MVPLKSCLPPPAAGHEAEVELCRRAHPVVAATVDAEAVDEVAADSCREVRAERRHVARMLHLTRNQTQNLVQALFDDVCDQLARAAERGVPQLCADCRRRIDAYAAGVNAAVEMMLSASLVAEPALSRVEPVSSSGPVSR